MDTDVGLERSESAIDKNRTEALHVNVRRQPSRVTRSCSALRASTAALLISAGSLSHAQEQPLLNFTWDDADGGVTDTILNPLVTDRPDWESTSTRGIEDDLFNPLFDLPAFYGNSRLEARDGFSNFAVPWGFSGSFSVSEDIYVSSVSFDYGANGLNGDGLLTTQMNGNDIGTELLPQTTPSQVSSNPAEGSAGYEFGAGDLILTEGQVDVDMSLVNTEPPTAPYFDINFNSSDGEDGYFWIDNFRIDYYTGLNAIEEIPEVILTPTDLPTMRERIGSMFSVRSVAPERQVADALSSEPCKDDTSGYQCATTAEQEAFFIPEEPLRFVLPDPRNRTWVQLSYDDMRYDAGGDNGSSGSDVSTFTLRAGATVARHSYGDGSVAWFDVTAHALESASTVDGVIGGGRIDTSGFGIGFAAAWMSPTGFYLDGQGQVTWTSTDVRGPTGDRLVHGQDGLSYALSIEAGRFIALSNDWIVTPQAQLTMGWAEAGSFTTSEGVDVTGISAERTTLRVGASLERAFGEVDADGEAPSSLFGFANVYNTLNDTRSVRADSLDLSSERSSLMGEIGVGFDLNTANDRLSLNGQVSMLTDLEGSRDSYGGNASLEVRYS